MNAMNATDHPAAIDRCTYDQAREAIQNLRSDPREVWGDRHAEGMAMIDGLESLLDEHRPVDIYLPGGGRVEFVTCTCQSHLPTLARCLYPCPTLRAIGITGP